MTLEEKKINLAENEELLSAENEGESWFSFQNLFAVLILNWQWFLLTIFIFLCGAFIYLRYTAPTYSVSARMLIKEDKNSRRSSANMLSNMQDLGFMTNSVGLENEMEILQSNLLLRDAVMDLKLYAPDLTQAKLIGEKILLNPAGFYGKVIEVALSNEEPPYDLSDN